MNRVTAWLATHPGARRVLWSWLSTLALVTLLFVPDTLRGVAIACRWAGW